jgi:pimeloyl-ACP methyl ester carboxylesterase
MTRAYPKWLGWAALLVLVAGMAFSGAASASGHAAGGLRPIVFVHGSSGSAAQFQTQALRFTSNGYPQELLYAFEYDTSQPFDLQTTLTRLDAFLSQILAETGADQSNVAAHSLGTFVMTTYLDTVPGGSAKVAGYVNIDGRAPAHLPGGVPTIGIWGEWNSGGDYARSPTPTQIGPNPEDNYYFPSLAHTEVATSAEAFAVMHAFFTGTEPDTTDVLPEPPGQVSVAGRVTIFPENIGFDGATLQVWHVDPRTGQRISRQPVATQTIDAGGDFGPFKVQGRKFYEFAVVRPDGSVHHFYQQPFARSDHFVRLNTSHAGAGIGAYVQTSDNHAALTVVRQREFWGDQGHLSDVLDIDGTSVLTPAIAPRRAVNAAVFAFDHGLDGQTSLDKGELFPFNFVTFVTAADVFVPATATADGSVRVALTHRGGQTSVINVPNWPSSSHRVTVQFRDYTQQAYGFTDYQPMRDR